MAIAYKLGIRTRHLCRDMAIRIESPRKGHRNPELAARAVQSAVLEAGLRAKDLAYLIGHTATPARLMPANIGEVAELLDYRGSFVEFRQACTGFANALVFAQGVLRAGAGPVAIVGSETGSVFFDPQRASEDAGQLVNLVQMGDGAAAIIVARDDDRVGDVLPPQRLASHRHSLRQTRRQLLLTIQAPERLWVELYREYMAAPLPTSWAQLSNSYAFGADRKTFPLMNGHERKNASLSQNIEFLEDKSTGHFLENRRAATSDNRRASA